MSFEGSSPEDIDMLERLFPPGGVFIVDEGEASYYNLYTM